MCRPTFIWATIMATIYRKTKSGAREVLRRQLALSVELRGLLAMIDGRCSVDDLIRKAPSLKFDQGSFDTLVSHGLAEEVFHLPPRGSGPIPEPVSIELPVDSLSPASEGVVESISAQGLSAEPLSAAERDVPRGELDVPSLKELTSTLGVVPGSPKNRGELAEASTGLAVTALQELGPQQRYGVGPVSHQAPGTTEHDSRAAPVLEHALEGGLPSSGTGDDAKGAAERPFTRTFHRESGSGGAVLRAPDSFESSASLAEVSHRRQVSLDVDPSPSQRLANTVKVYAAPVAPAQETSAPALPPDGIAERSVEIVRVSDPDSIGDHDAAAATRSPRRGRNSAVTSRSNVEENQLHPDAARDPSPLALLNGQNEDRSVHESAGDPGHQFLEARQHMMELVHRTWWRGAFLLKRIKRSRSMVDLQGLREDVINLLASSDPQFSRDVVKVMDRLLYPARGS
jgi:hypothetical protein